MYEVSYVHMPGSSKQCRVVQRFATQAQAQEMIDCNALVHPLPGVELYEICDRLHRLHAIIPAADPARGQRCPDCFAAPGVAHSAACGARDDRPEGWSDIWPGLDALLHAEACEGAN